MESAILKVIEINSPFPLHEVLRLYEISGKSYDKTVTAIGYACATNTSPAFAIRNMNAVLNTKVKLTIWQKIKKCWEILRG